MKKSIAISVWILITALYCWSLSDIGRSMGANINSAIENYSEMMVEYGGTTTDFEHLGSAIADMYSYNTFHDLEKEFKFDFTVIAVTSVIYLVFTIGCYHFSFAKKKKKSSTKEMLG